ncbi:hypothetical protein EYC80_009014 [Monilinia laxa]|uniref:Uncharacterized protein n=1 Tax=Monilinia laxa TaxID=61186 RepID=A0A5N6K245_MONLA|nr:hypothetical protein EYC80_009014 [Monilinia laxa]
MTEMMRDGIYMSVAFGMPFNTLFRGRWKRASKFQVPSFKFQVSIKGVFKFLNSHRHLSSTHLMAKSNIESEPSLIPCPFNLT